MQGKVGLYDPIIHKQNKTMEFTNCCMLLRHLIFTNVRSPVVTCKRVPCTDIKVYICEHCKQQYILSTVCTYVKKSKRGACKHKTATVRRTTT